MQIAIFASIKPKHPNIATTKLSPERNKSFILLPKEVTAVIL